MSTIAIVEDNPDNLLLLRVLLGEAYQLREYGDGNKAVKGIIAEPPDLVLMDISLPGMDGNIALQHLRAQPNLRDLPVIALTANAMIGDREKYLSEGFDGYISKPIVDQEQLFATIRGLLARNASVDQDLATTLVDLRQGYERSLAKRRSELEHQWNAVQHNPQSHSSWQALKVTAHQLAGSAASFGYDALGETAQRLDSAIREVLLRPESTSPGQVEVASHLVTELDSQLHNASGPERD